MKIFCVTYLFIKYDFPFIMKYYFLILSLSLFVLFSGFSVLSSSAFAETFYIEMAKNSHQSSCADTNNCFVPSTTYVEVGDTVKWYNDDLLRHNVRSGIGTESNVGSMFDSGSIVPGEYYEHTFDSTGTFHFHDSNYPFMKGKVIVREISNTPTDQSLILENVNSISIDDITTSPQIDSRWDIPAILLGLVLGFIMKFLLEKERLINKVPLVKPIVKLKRFILLVASLVVIGTFVNSEKDSITNTISTLDPLQAFTFVNLEYLLLGFLTVYVVSLIVEIWPKLDNYFKDGLR